MPSCVIVADCPAALTIAVRAAALVFCDTTYPIVSGPPSVLAVVIVRKLALLETDQGQPYGAVSPRTPLPAAAEMS